MNVFRNLTMNNYIMLTYEIQDYAVEQQMTNIRATTEQRICIILHYHTILNIIML